MTTSNDIQKLNITWYYLVLCFLPYYLFFTSSVLRLWDVKDRHYCFFFFQEVLGWWIMAHDDWLEFLSPLNKPLYVWDGHVLEIPVHHLSCIWLISYRINSSFFSNILKIIVMHCDFLSHVTDLSRLQQ